MPLSQHSPVSPASFLGKSCPGAADPISILSPAHRCSAAGSHYSLRVSVASLESSWPSIIFMHTVPGKAARESLLPVPLGMLRGLETSKGCAILAPAGYPNLSWVWPWGEVVGEGQKDRWTCA